MEHRDLQPSSLTPTENLILELEAYCRKDTGLAREDFTSISACMWLLKYPPIWSDNPRLYYILQKLDQPELFNVFFDAGFTDIWLPFPYRTLRRLLKADDIDFFYSVQSLCLDGRPSEPLGQGHFSLADAGDLGFEEGPILGSGGYGEVRAVKDRQTRQLYAMKTLWRPPAHKQHLNWMNSFKKEVEGMRRVSHQHCVNLVASFTDLNSFMLLCSPVADMDLAKFLDSDLNASQFATLYRAVGCITSALTYLHSMHIRHDDLKPNNILIHGHNVLLTDFGFCLDSSDSGISTTSGPPSHVVRRYSAPEVFECTPRSRLTDIWGLGCVLFEIMSRIYGHKPSIMKLFWQSHGTNRDSYAENSEATTAWYDSLNSQTVDPRGSWRRHDVMTLSFVYHVVMEPDRLLRPTGAQVLDKLKDIDFVYPVRQATWISACCKGQTAYVPKYLSVQGCNDGPFASFLDLPPWPILDPTYLTERLEYLFLDLDLEVIACSKNIDYVADSEGPSDSVEVYSIERFVASPAHRAYLRSEVSAIGSQAALNGAWNPSNRSSLTLPGMLKSLYTCALGNTPSAVCLLDLEWNRNQEGPKYHTVQLTFVTSCLQGQDSFGTPFYALIFDPNEGELKSEQMPVFLGDKVD